MNYFLHALRTSSLKATLSLTSLHPDPELLRDGASDREAEVVEVEAGWVEVEVMEGEFVEAEVVEVEAVETGGGGGVVDGG